MTPLDQLCHLLSKLPMDAAGREECDRLVEGALRERDELVAAVRELYDPLDHHGPRENIDALLARYPVNTALDEAPTTGRHLA